MFGYGQCYANGSWKELKFSGREDWDKNSVCDLQFDLIDARDKTFAGFSGSPIYDEECSFVIGLILQEECADHEAIYIEGISVSSQKDFFEKHDIVVNNTNLIRKRTGERANALQMTDCYITGVSDTIDELNNMRKFYLRHPDYHLVSDKLSWSHICELIKIDDDLERSFYEKEAVSEKWGVRELQRQMESALFLRLAVSRDKEGILSLAQVGIEIQTPEDVIKNTYTLEFLNIPELKQYSEGDMEQRIIDNLQIFLLELGKGFTFVGRQYKITVNNIHYHVDLVFYHRILKCFVLIDLKENSVRHEDIGQMNMYLGYFAMEENMPDDNASIGIILSKNKDELLVEYATSGMDSNLFVSKYELYLPNRKELEKLVYNILHDDIQNG